MKIYTFLLPAIIGVMILLAWMPGQSYDIKKVEWLIGTWENKTSRGSIYESWNRTNDHELSGRSYMVKEKDTAVFETVQIIYKDNNLYYIPTVANQNNALPVSFTGKSISDSLLVFENQQHDFPQFIIYKRINTDSLVAEIAGMKNGAERKQVFRMKRIK